MLVKLSLENWMSFKERTTFLMVACQEKQHSKRLAHLQKYKTKILPIAAIYGGNASGKTNFFQAISFAKQLIVSGTRPDTLIPVEPFRLDEDSLHLPSRFSFEIFVDDNIYEFSFAVTRKVVVEEKLVLITKTSEKILYDRKDDYPNFDSSLKKDELLNFAFKGTRENQLFLTNSVSQKVEKFAPVYNWFKNTLELIAPDSRFGSWEHFIDENHPLYSTMSELLPQLDTGIARLSGDETPFDNLGLSSSIKSELQENVKEGKSVKITSDANGERFIITRGGSGELVAKKLVTYHSQKNGPDIKFELRQESDGSQRVIDLLPALLELASPQNKKVYVIDEIDRSLHTLLTRKLLELFLDSCGNDGRSQLLLTTHDVLLMDQDLLRRDEMWITERDIHGGSHLLSFSEYKDVRSDKNIRKSYLQGRLGGIPKILFNSALKMEGKSSGK